MKKIEKQVSATILQKPKAEVSIGGRIYKISAPTPATLIRVSELIAELPQLKMDSNNILSETLATAKDCKIIGEICAILILGAKKERDADVSKWSWRKFRFVKDREVRQLANDILYECEIKDMCELVTSRLLNMQIGDFFALTASLFEANLLRRTKEAETVYGE